VYFSAGLYAEMALQSYYLFAAIAGWIGWHRTSNTDGYIGVLRMKIAHWWYAVGVGSSTGALLGFILWQQTKSPIAFADSLIATSSLVATWFMVKRYLENWLMWVVIDSACIIVYLHKGLFSFAGLFVLYTLLALKGYFDWKKPTPYNA
jgi:nicotinamide mononucleotide transporter